MSTDTSTPTHHLPQMGADLFLADGGIETTLIFDEGIDLPDFASFVLLDTEEGRAALRRYFDAYLDVAARDGVGIVLETPTWRASADWGARLGYDLDRLAATNREAVALTRAVAEARADEVGAPVVVSGCIGPRGDGYEVGTLMDPAEARRYHSLQAKVFAESGVDLITGITIPYTAEGIGIAEAARRVGLPCVIAFTVETDGTLPSGESLRSAIEAVDEATDGSVAYFMVSCAHPTHFAHVLEPGAAWTARIGGIRANASTMSHAELDEAEVLDPGDPVDLGQRYRDLRAAHPSLTVVGGCCGTSHHHIDAISRACAPSPAR